MIVNSIIRVEETELSPDQERFLAKVQQSDSCWIWLGAHARSSGYGFFWLDGRMQGAHRVSYMLFVGNLVSGQQVHHTCKNKSCVNPSHLVQLSRSSHALEHVSDNHQTKKTHCPHNHPYDEVNTMIVNGKRQCRECCRRRRRDWYKKTHDRK